MSSNYDQIRSENIREYGEGTRHLSFLGRLYTDRTHFIFELLQNAEDAEATKILFKLFSNRLEVKHNGRPFNENDVRGVCGVGEGTKAEDLTQIGRFGIGFKSVYAYTSRPEIHSGSEHFQVESYVRPHLVSSKIPGKCWTTLFVFSFDAPDIEASIAVEEIADRLRNLSARTLLFLKKIKEIEYQLRDEEDGIYLRESVSQGQARQVSVIGQNNGIAEDERWLVFEKLVSVSDNADSVRVEIAFLLEAKEKKNPERVVKVNDSPLFVYFPTEKATRLGFLVQGPYRTTPARDNIPKDDEWNKWLILETAQLVVEALRSLKDMKLLTVSLLEALPIRSDDFPEGEMFYPIMEAVRNALISENLIPADDGAYISATQSKLARGAELRKLISTKQLQELFSEAEMKWLSGGITQDKTPDLRSYLINDLNIEEVTPTSFARKTDRGFFNKQSNEWFISFYRYLRSQEALWEYGDLRWKKFIRLESGDHVQPFDEGDIPQAYLPVEDHSEFPVVASEIAQDKEALEFLIKLGLTEPDAVAEVIEKIIPKYSHDSPALPIDEHLEDMQKILKAYSVDSDEKKEKLLEKLTGIELVRAQNPISQQIQYMNPKGLYFREQSLFMYFDGNENAWFISPEYDRDEGFFGLFKELGVSNKVNVIRKKPRWDSRHVTIIRQYGWHRRGLNGFDPDIQVDGLKYALHNPSVKKSEFIWNCILLEYQNAIRGIIEFSSRQTYEDSHKQEKVSSEFGEPLMEYSWLPDRDGEFHLPGHLALSDLPDFFERNEGLADQLGMKKDVVAKLAEAVGISAEDIELLKHHPDEFEEWKAALTIKHTKPIFPTRASGNPDLRAARVKGKLADAPDKEYEARLRSVRTSNNSIDPRPFLKETYTNEEGKMVCQICTEEMPFKKLDGEYYFEAVEISKVSLDIEEEVHFIALCPLCGAKYKYFIKQDDNIQRQVVAELRQTEFSTIPLSLGEEKAALRFVETHLADLKAVIETLETNHD